jgi:hypothetical protein
MIWMRLWVYVWVLYFSHDYTYTHTHTQDAILSENFSLPSLTIILIQTHNLIQLGIADWFASQTAGWSIFQLFLSHHILQEKRKQIRKILFKILFKVKFKTFEQNVCISFTEFIVPIFSSKVERKSLVCIISTTTTSTSTKKKTKTNKRQTNLSITKSSKNNTSNKRSEKKNTTTNKSNTNNSSVATTSKIANVLLRRCRRIVGYSNLYRF